MENRILVDTSILIELQRNNKHIMDVFEKSIQEIFISRITSCEMIIGSKNNKEKSINKEFLNELEVIDFDESVSKLSYELIDKYLMKMKLSTPDALIASTVLLGNMKVWTLDQKHLGKIEGLSFLKT